MASPVGKSRLEAYSDGVFAIVVTLLVLDVRLPESGPESAEALALQLWHVAPKVASWVLSFVMATIVWVNHHQFLHQLRHVDRTFLFMNSLLLLCVSFVPFPTGVLGAHAMDPAALRFFGAAFLAAGVSFFALRLYARRAGLYEQAIEPRMARDATRRSFVAVAGYVAGIAVAGTSAFGAWACYVVVAVWFVLPSHAERGTAG